MGPGAPGGRTDRHPGGQLLRPYLPPSSSGVLQSTGVLGEALWCVSMCPISDPPVIRGVVMSELRCDMCCKCPIIIMANSSAVRTSYYTIYIYAFTHV